MAGCYEKEKLVIIIAMKERSLPKHGEAFFV